MLLNYMQGVLHLTDCIFSRNIFSERCIVNETKEMGVQYKS